MNRKEIIYRVDQRGCHICISHCPDSSGYPQMKRAGRHILIHRHIFEQAYGPIPEGMCVCHTCDTPACINPEHFFLGTNLDNVKDRDRKGRRQAPRGMSSTSARLTDEQVRVIRRSSETNRTLGRRYGIAYGQDFKNTRPSPVS